MPKVKKAAPVKLKKTSKKKVSQKKKPLKDNGFIFINDNDGEPIDAFQE
ncbi:hypothetical protein [Endomicrobium proavitum]|uniref:Uncharacterized protein n=1 Tax=Endomicrobium proavitum TaxID=1408281 RepID=A0A0G3WKD6_9BACT|nr:hypothetical protein [Endomicrobium proavitum]AKL98365.1 hypothetical protein Epro_0986 [Endomicrobium proavitum]